MNWMNNDACRFYVRGNRVRHNGGIHNRQYCYHTAAWLSSHPNWHATYQTGGVGGYAPGFPAANPGFANPGFQNPGFATPGFQTPMQGTGGWVCQPGQGGRSA